MKKFFKPSVILPIIIGAIIGAVLFMLGDADDSPGLSFIGFVTAFLMSMWGIYNSGVIKKGHMLPIILLCFGAGVLLMTTALLLDGEFGQAPYLACVGIGLGAVLLGIGAFTLHRRAQK